MLRTGIREIEIEEADLLSEIEEVTGRFRGKTRPTEGCKPTGTSPNGAGVAMVLPADA
nr:TraC family protein [Rhizobium sp. 2MFCol3.1]